MGLSRERALRFPPSQSVARLDNARKAQLMLIEALKFSTKKGDGPILSFRF